MEFNKETVGLAVKTGLELLGDESEITIPAKLNDGVFFLKQLLVAIAKGELSLGNAVEPDTPTPPPKKHKHKTK